MAPAVGLAWPLTRFNASICSFYDLPAMVGPKTPQNAIEADLSKRRGIAKWLPI